jgi:uncharacterized protein YrrD
VLHRMKDLEGYTIGATDGVIGHVKDFYFDDEAWVIRYLVVETGDWLSHRHVLISPIAINQPNWSEKIFPAAISQEQVRNSPSIDTAKPVYRQHERTYLDYYGYPYYWGGSGFWGNSVNPGMMGWDAGSGATASASHTADANKMPIDADPKPVSRRQADPHLRSGNEIFKYNLHAVDGDIGHVEGLLVDEKAWAIRYIVVNTGNWWSGHRVIVAPQWIEGLNWEEKTVSISLTRDAVRSSPPYAPGAQMGRDEESRIFHHYGKPGYWGREVQLQNPEFRIIPSAPPGRIDTAL